MEWVLLNNEGCGKSMDRQIRLLSGTAYFGSEYDDVLPALARTRLAQTRKRITERMKDADGSGAGLYWDARACLDRLDAVLLQAYRMRRHANFWYWKPAPGSPGVAELVPKSLLVITATEACVDFESLLFHGRAALDRVTLMIDRMQNGNCSSFSSFSNILRSIVPPERSRRLQALVSECAVVRSVLLSGPDRKGLRDQVAHRAAFSEGTTILFTVFRCADGRLLVFDAKVFGVSVIHTACALAAEIPYLVINMITVALGFDEPEPMTAFRGSWADPFIDRDEFISENQEHLRFPVGMRATHGAFTMNWQRVRPELFNRAIPFAPTFTRI